MDTKILGTTVDNIKEAADILRAGGIVAFPTETVYGIGAIAYDEAAVAKIYQAKGRPSDNPMIVHIGETSQVRDVVREVSGDAGKLMNRFWPGPLTLVMKKSYNVPDIVTGGLDTVAVRVPGNDIARKLLLYTSLPIAAPSANLSGKPSATSFSHVFHDLNGRVDAIIKADDSKLGIESTVVDMTGRTPTVLRPGMILPSQISDVLKSMVDVKCDTVDTESPLSPGLKYKHYSPKAKITIYKGPESLVKVKIDSDKKDLIQKGHRVGVMRFDESMLAFEVKNFFKRLREYDEMKVTHILAYTVNTNDELGFALMDRLLKASGYNIVEV